MACDVRVLAVGPGCGGRGVGRHALPTPRCHAAAPSSTTGSVSMMFCSRIATSRPAGAVPSPLCAWRPPRAEWGAWKCDCRTISTASSCAAPAFQISAGSVTSGVWLPAWILTRARFRSKRWPTERISSVRGRRHLGVPGDTKALPGGRAPSKRCAMHVRRMSRPRRPNESEMLATLMEIRHLRVSTQHNDAGHKAIEAFSQLGVTFPVAS
jgi:hypothetical protein